MFQFESLLSSNLRTFKFGSLDRENVSETRRIGKRKGGVSCGILTPSSVSGPVLIYNNGNLQQPLLLLALRTKSAFNVHVILHLCSKVNFILIIKRAISDKIIEPSV